MIALRRRPVDPERVERMINGIIRQMESSGESEIQTEAIGDLVLEGLKSLDDVAYVRFASVYKDFQEAQDFIDSLESLRSNKKQNQNSETDQWDES